LLIPQLIETETEGQKSGGQPLSGPPRLTMYKNTAMMYKYARRSLSSPCPGAAFGNHAAGHKFAENILDFVFARNGRPL